MIINQQIVPKLRNIKIELEYVEEYRDMIDLKCEHIRSLMNIISKLQQVYPTHMKLPIFTEILSHISPPTQHKLERLEIIGVV